LGLIEARGVNVPDRNSSRARGGSRPGNKPALLDEDGFGCELAVHDVLADGATVSPHCDAGQRRRVQFDASGSRGAGKLVDEPHQIGTGVGGVGRDKSGDLARKIRRQPR
jgi:hypothetical protein